MTHDTEPREPACRQPPETIVVQIRKYVEPFLSAIGAVEVGDSRDPPAITSEQAHLLYWAVFGTYSRAIT